MKILYPDSEKEFISTMLKEFCNYYIIAIQYIALYLHKKNKLTKQGWKILAIIKDWLLINNGLSNNFLAEAMETLNYLQNRLPTKNGNHGELIFKESWTGNK